MTGWMRVEDSKISRSVTAGRCVGMKEGEINAVVEATAG